MHVGLLIYGSLDIISGGFIYDRHLVRYLREAGDRVDVISSPLAPLWLKPAGQPELRAPPPANAGRL